MMKRTLLLLSLFLFVAVSNAQVRIKDKKYPSLLWEISGKGMAKPSYLIGTMHVSNKLAFHLPDSFYIAVRNAKVVALETNPETWQDDMNKYDVSGDGYSFGNEFVNYGTAPNDYLHISTLKFYRYEKKIEKSLYSNPSVINNLLYRSFGNDASDFEEDTYLDMYIYQCGKRLGKKVTGVEDYGESMQLMVEAYQDAAKDKNRKQRSYDGGEEYSGTKLQEAYRNGNLDLLDTINKYNSVSAAFDEKFLYRRNEIQAYSIDSIIKSGSALFVGVGAAHLPGDRGVIELLRKKGYKLRPVKMGERDSRDKDLIEKIRVPVTFKTSFADDSLFKVDIPGKLYKTSENPATTTDERQYTDMANGSYYMVTRIMTNALMWGDNADVVMKKVDSMLYENIPGKILSKSNITRNGYKGIELTNRTRRGDIQRYNIFVTPFEVIIFKISGNGDYVKNGEEANKFFGSIQFKEYKNGSVPAATAWKKYSPPSGGFAIDLPHEPYTGNDGSWIFDAEDKSTNTQYRVIRTDIHNYRFAEEDTFDLGLMNESFMASEFVDSQYYRKQFNCKGYPAFDAKYRDKTGHIFLVRFLIQGPHYYTLAAHGKQETPQMNNFLNSFDIKPFLYGEAKQQKDTSLYYTVTTPVYPEEKKIRLEIPRYSYFGIDNSEDEEESESDQLEAGAYRSKIVSNDTTGEKIFISFTRASRYHYSKDSADIDIENEHPYADSTWIFKMKNKTTLPNKMKVWETIATDSGSSRAIWAKTFYKDGITFCIATQTDTLTKPSAFLRKFFETFAPADTLKGVDPFVKKSNLFFDDFMSRDSVLHKRAVAAIEEIDVDSTDLSRLQKAIASLNWDEKKYLATKKSLISKLGEIVTNASADYLEELYYALDDTVSVQYAVLENLLQHKTAYAYNIFRNIINTEPPVKDANYSEYEYEDYSFRGRRRTSGYLSNFSIDNGDFMDELSDSLQLTKSILPDLLPLLNLDDYKDDMMKLLGEMVDSSVLKPADYEMYYSKFMLEARQELKKQSIAEKKKAIEKAEESKEDKNRQDAFIEKEEDDYGNDNLSLYANLLLPFWDSKPAVQPLFHQMLRSGDKRLKYNTMMLLLKHDKAFPDTLLKYFAKLDEYRYELYSDLKEIKKFDKFPKIYNNHLDLGKSSLIYNKSYDKPDSVVFVERLAAGYMNKKGFIYFYKYKDKKDDMTWKLATVGLVPEAPGEFEFTDSIVAGINPRYLGLYKFDYGRSYLYDFTGFTETKISDEESLEKQLAQALKKLLYSRRESAEEFYGDENDRSDWSPGNIRF
jgi:uncharacterized protein YbaP (TraB family)